MLEQTLNGRPITINRVGNEYMVYYDHEIIFTSVRPITDQERENIIFEVNNVRGRMLGNILAQLLQPLLNSNP